MKIEEVPQDAAFLIEGKIRDVCYVLDEKGRYTKILSKGWAPKNDAIRLAWDKVYENANETRQKILAGILSPIALYMELNVMNLKILSNYTGIPQRKVRKHLKMKGFRRLTPDHLKKYADALDLTVEELSDIDKIRTIKISHED